MPMAQASDLCMSIRKCWTSCFKGSRTPHCISRAWIVMCMKACTYTSIGCFCIVPSAIILANW